MNEESRASQPSETWSARLQALVLEWFKIKGRDFPWRHTANPFHILVAEVLLRQTQAWRVKEPYLQLTKRYPKPESLADANLNELQRWFEPLGLVRRAHHLVQMAQALMTRYGGEVPPDLAALMSLPGLGHYSARAVLCLAFAVPVSMIDEGSGRVLRRVLKASGQVPAYRDAWLLETAERLLPRQSAREFNLGLIDIGAAYCHHRAPSCAGCPLVGVCLSTATESAIHPYEAVS